MTGGQMTIGAVVPALTRTIEQPDMIAYAGAIKTAANRTAERMGRMNNPESDVGFPATRTAASENEFQRERK